MTSPTSHGMTFSHYAEKPITGQLYPVKQGWESDYRSCYDKPKGLWVSVDGDDDWLAWCKSENFALDRCVSRHRVDIDLTRVLVLPSPLSLDMFQDEFARSFERAGYTDLYIDWPAVADRYAGIVIAPYHWSRRMSMRWYYGWDCASGCIWDPSVVTGIELLREAA